MSRNSEQVVVIGGGLGGLAAACVLAVQNIHPLNPLFEYVNEVGPLLITNALLVVPRGRDGSGARPRRIAPRCLRTLCRARVVRIDLGVRRLTLCDTVGHATPDGIRNLVDWTRDLIKGTGEDVKLDWHGHNDRGLGLANALTAIEAGVDRRLHVGAGHRVQVVLLGLRVGHARAFAAPARRSRNSRAFSGKFFCRARPKASASSGTANSRRGEDRSARWQQLGVRVAVLRAARPRVGHSLPSFLARRVTSGAICVPPVRSPPWASAPALPGIARVARNSCDLRGAYEEWQGRMRRYLEMHWEGRRIWGVTAAIIMNLARRLEAAGYDPTVQAFPFQYFDDDSVLRRVSPLLPAAPQLPRRSALEA